MKITAGIDAGRSSTKVVILNGGSEPIWLTSPGDNESTAQLAQRVLSEAAEKAKVSIKDLEHIVATGAGRTDVTFASQKLVEFLCLAKGIDFLLPTTRILLDLGARKSLAIKCSGGKVLKFAASDKCAAGSGVCLEMAATILGVNIYDLDELFFKSKENVEIQSTCSIFAESEIISLVHNKTKTEDIVRGIFRGLAGRVYSQLLELGIEKDVAVVGGVAKSKAMIAVLEEKVGFKILVPENPQIVGALGAAIIAKEGARRSVVS